ncbi:MAG: hypothetical protein JW875_02555 [Spirochaetales bacterium]|nr:hypothetical protein [Spirochaetales bacterium]
MKKYLFVSLCALCALSLSLVSCFQDLDPAKPGEATLAFSVATLLPPAQAESRAVAPGTGYLYIRTFGGPSSSGPLYGPFTLAAGATFKTSAIPSGSYDAIGVIYAISPLDARSVVIDGVSRTFREIMLLSDDEFNRVTDNPDGSDPLGDLIDGLASGDLIEKVSLPAGKVTSLSLTLVPMTGSFSLDVGADVFSLSRDCDASSVTRRFIEFSSVQTPDGIPVKSLSCTITPVSGGTYLGVAALYDDKGTLIKSFQLNKDLSGPEVLSADYSGDSQDFYLYLEYRTTKLLLSLSRTFDESNLATLTVNFTGSAATVNKRLFYGVYSTSAVTVDVTNGEFDASGDPVAVGFTVLDASGSGSAKAYLLSSATPAILAPGDYYITAFVDTNNNYTDITGAASLSPNNDIMPHYNDLVTTNSINNQRITISASKPHTFELNASQFSPSTDYVYFVSQDGTGTGARASSPTALTSTLMDTWKAQDSNIIYLVSDIAFGQAITLGNNTTTSNYFITSFGERKKVAISFGNPTFAVNANSTGILSNIELVGANLPGSALINVSGTLMIEEGALLRDNNCNGSAAGAINLKTGGVVYMNGGEITRCIATYGGGMYISGTGKFYFNGGTINACEAKAGGDGAGGGVFILSGDMYLNGGTITGCKALATGASGGGVAVDSMGKFFLYKGLITNNTANSGAGLFVKSGGIFSDLSEGNISSIITGNHNDDVEIPLP